MNFELTSEQIQLQDASIRLRERRLEPILRTHGKDVPLSKAVMLDIFAALAEFGLTGARVPIDAGGTGLKALDYGLAFEQLPAVVALALIAHDGTTSRLCASVCAQNFHGILAKLLPRIKIDY